MIKIGIFFGAMVILFVMTAWRFTRMIIYVVFTPISYLYMSGLNFKYANGEFEYLRLEHPIMGIVGLILTIILWWIIEKNETFYATHIKLAKKWKEHREK